MPVKDIVSCWVTRTLQPGNSIETIVTSLHEAGFKTAKQSGTDTIRLKRGSPVGGFDYDSEGLEVQVILERAASGELTFHVGNRGFPFDPLLMKNRFRRLADRLEQDIQTHGHVVPTPNESQEVEAAKKQARSNFLALILIGTPVAGIVGATVTWLILIS